MEWDMVILNASTKGLQIEVPLLRVSIQTIRVISQQLHASQLVLSIDKTFIPPVSLWKVVVEWRVSHSNQIQKNQNILEKIDIKINFFCLLIKFITILWSWVLVKSRLPSG
jgi:hypothetical protein